MAHLPTGVGRYEVRRLLGQGGFASVYEAYDPLLDRKVALKVLHAHLASESAVRTRFVREGRALARVHHPNLVPVFDAGEDDGVAYLAMELVEGTPLSLAFRSGRAPWNKVLPVLDDIAAALDAVHTAGLVHRDVKPANILVGADGRTVLLDLGIAREVAPQTSITATDQLIGTLQFLAPEQIASSGQVGPRTDIYQLAATAYAVLAGRPPFEGDTARVLFAIANEQPPDLALLRPDLPLRAVAAIHGAMAKDPAGRPSSAGEFVGQLHGAAANLAPTVFEDTPPAVVRRPVTRMLSTPRRLAAVAAVAVVLLVLGGLGTGLFRSDGEGMPGAKEASALSVSPDGEPVTAEVDGEPVEFTFETAGAQRVAAYLLSEGVQGDITVVSSEEGVLFADWLAGELFIDPAQVGPGRHRLRFEPEDNSGGQVTLSLFTVPEDVTGVLSTNGSPSDALLIEVPGQNALLHVDSVTAGRMSLVLTTDTLSGHVSLLDSEGRPVSEPSWFSAPGGLIGPIGLPDTGSYSVLIDPEGISTGQVTVEAWDVPNDVEELLLPGEPTTVEIQAPGQAARLHFDGEQGNRVSLLVSDASMDGPVVIEQPNGLTLGPSEWLAVGGGFIEPRELPTTGTYSVLLEESPPGQMMFTLFEVPPDLRGSLRPNGEPVDIALEAPGQNAEVTFQGQAGQSFALEASNVTFEGTVAVLRPDGADIVEPQWVSSGGLDIPFGPIPDSGTYVIVVDPEASSVGFSTLALSQR